MMAIKDHVANLRRCFVNQPNRYIGEVNRESLEQVLVAYETQERSASELAKLLQETTDRLTALQDALAERDRALEWLASEGKLLFHDKTRGYASLVQGDQFYYGHTPLAAIQAAAKEMR